MKRFTFRLEAVRKLRTLLEERCRNELGHLMVERQNVLEQIAAVEKAIADAYREQEGHLAGGMRASHLAFFPMSTEGREARIRQLQTEVERLEGLIAEKRADLNQKRADLKLIENLREKDLRAWKKAYEKDENLKVEEMVQLWKENQRAGQEDV